MGPTTNEQGIVEIKYPESLTDHFLWFEVIIPSNMNNQVPYKICYFWIDAFVVTVTLWKEGSNVVFRFFKATLRDGELNH